MKLLKSAYFRTLYREIGRSPGRFVNIILLMIIGAGLFYGQRISVPSLEANLDKYFAESNFFDVWIHSDIGFHSKIEDYFRTVPDVDKVQFEIHSEAQAEWNDYMGVVQIFGIPESGFVLNKPQIADGRMPHSTGECLADAGSSTKYPLNIGDVIAIGDKEFTVVGTAHIPYYIKHLRDSTKLGSGKTEGFILIREADFPEPRYYTDVYFTVRTAIGIDFFSEEYDEIVTDFLAQIVNSGSLMASSAADFTSFEYRVRKSLFGYQEFIGDIQNINDMFSILPVLIFIIALFICSSSMMRVVDAKKYDVNVMLSLGAYGKTVNFPFYVFSAAACLLGVSIGLFGGRLFGPTIFSISFKSLYPGLPIASPKDSLPILLLTVFISILFCMIATFIAIRKLDKKKGFKEDKSSSHLLRNLPFYLQITLKNALRYRGRSVICILSVIASVLLLFFIYSATKTIYDTLDVQYKELQKYDAVIGLPKESGTTQSDPTHASNYEKIIEVLSENPAFQDSIVVYQKLAAVRYNESELYAALVIPSDINKFADYHVIRNDKTFERIIMEDNSVFISAGAAKYLNVKIGDEIHILVEGHNFNVTITGIFESHFIHEIFISPTFFDGDYQAAYIKMPEFDDEVSKKLFAEHLVESVSIVEDNIQRFIGLRSMMISMLYIFGAMIIIFVTIVIYNLSVMTFLERKREIQILEQIGYTNFDVRVYLSREVAVIAAVGFIVACIVCCLISNTFIGFLDGESVIYVKKIYPGGIIFAVSVTAFTLIAAYWGEHIYNSLFQKWRGRHLSA